jgi:hypothetical protein
MKSEKEKRSQLILRKLYDLQEEMESVLNYNADHKHYKLILELIKNLESDICDHQDLM